MQFAVKKLTRLDLTFFEHQFRRQNAGNQKSINLNADVFVDLIFPYARTIAAGQPHPFPVKLQIYGPGLRRTPTCRHGACTLSREGGVLAGQQARVPCPDHG
jgi:hypothetical protein